MLLIRHVAHAKITVSCRRLLCKAAAVQTTATWMEQQCLIYLLCELRAPLSPPPSPLPTLPPAPFAPCLATQIGKHAASFCAFLADVVFLLFYACFGRVKSFVGHCLLYDSVHIHSCSALGWKGQALFCHQSEFVQFKVWIFEVYRVCIISVFEMRKYLYYICSYSACSWQGKALFFYQSKLFTLQSK